MKAIKRVGIMSVAKLEAVIMAIIGLISGLIFAVAGASLATLGALVGGSTGMLLSLGMLAVVVWPIAFAIMGFIGGAIGAFLYNVVAKWTGGIELHFDKE